MLYKTEKNQSNILGCLWTKNADRVKKSQIRPIELQK